MPFVEHRGQRIHYTVDGDGPAVVLQHGILMSGESWKRGGIVDALVDRYRVVCVDSLGHGASDKPSEPALYEQRQRAGDIVAVLDDLDCGRANLVGHSMGAWLAVGVAKYYPERLSSLVLGGWDFVNGLPPTSRGPLTFDAFMKFAGRTAPDLVAWVTPAYEPGLHACFDALDQLDGARDAVVDSGVPVLIWEAGDDPAHDHRKALAEAAGLAFLSTPGDHLGMLLVHGAEAAKGIRAFVARGNP
jgi:pimeloyl-ACP methyl ester carboxylesterase